MSPTSAVVDAPRGAPAEVLQVCPVADANPSCIFLPCIVMCT